MWCVQGDFFKHDPIPLIGHVLEFGFFRIFNCIMPKDHVFKFSTLFCTAHRQYPVTIQTSVFQTSTTPLFTKNYWEDDFAWKFARFECMLNRKIPTSSFRGIKNLKYSKIWFTSVLKNTKNLSLKICVIRT